MFSLLSPLEEEVANKDNSTRWLVIKNCNPFLPFFLKNKQTNKTVTTKTAVSYSVALVGWAGTCYMDQAGLKLELILLPLAHTIMYSSDHRNFSRTNRHQIRA